MTALAGGLPARQGLARSRARQRNAMSHTGNGSSEVAVPVVYIRTLRR